MADEVEKYRIPLFDGTNFNNWKFRMETLLDEMDLLKLVEKPYANEVQFSEDDTQAERGTKEKKLEELAKRDRKCKSQIIQRISDSHLEYAKDKKTAFDMWRSLNAIFERKGIASQLLIRKSLLTMKFNAQSDTLANHFLKFDKKIRELRSTGANLEENDVVCHLLLTMPTEYDTVVTSIETLSMEDLSTGFVKNRLLDEESKLKDRGVQKIKNESPSTTAFSSTTNSGTARGKSRAFPFHCHQCGIYGHRKADCRKKPQESSNEGNSRAHVASNHKGENSDNEQKFCFSITIQTIGCAANVATYYLDSGATEHLVSSEVPLHNVEVLKEPVIINVAKTGAFLKADKVGEVEVISCVKGKDIPITIKNVLSVPGLNYNLISVRKLEMKGYTITFRNGEGTIQKGNVTLAVGSRKESQLYALNFRQISTSANACASVPAENEKLWHERFGHLNYESIKKLQGQVDGMNMKMESSPGICDTCIEGKQSKLPHNQPRICAKRPLQLVHSDLFGPITPTSYDDKKYVLTIIDDYTHFNAAYTMESKSEVFKYLKIYEAMVTAHFNLKISRFRCDNGREYLSNEIKIFFQEKGIQFEFTIRYTPQQNGVAERMNRTIIEKARCMLLHSKLEKEFWSEAALTAVYLINRSPTSTLDGKIPASLWFNETPNIKKSKFLGVLRFCTSQRKSQLESLKQDQRDASWLVTVRMVISSGVQKITKSYLGGMLLLTRKDFRLKKPQVSSG